MRPSRCENLDVHKKVHISSGVRPLSAVAASGSRTTRWLSARVTPEAREWLDTLLKRRGMSFQDWLVYQIQRDLEETARPPESQGDVKRVVPLDLAMRLHELAYREGDRLWNEAKALPPSKAREQLRQRARLYQDDACWLADTIEGYRYREHILANGFQKTDGTVRAIQPRHRYAGRPDSSTNTDQAPPSP